MITRSVGLIRQHLMVMMNQAHRKYRTWLGFVRFIFTRTYCLTAFMFAWLITKRKKFNVQSQIMKKQPSIWSTTNEKEFCVNEEASLNNKIQIFFSFCKFIIKHHETSGSFWPAISTSFWQNIFFSP